MEQERKFNSLGEAYETGYADGMKDATKWIPCSERMPEDMSKPYDVTIKSIWFGETVIETDVCTYREDGMWDDMEGVTVDGYDHKVVAWKERSKPWEEKK